MSRAAYGTDLTDTEWQLVDPYVRTTGLGQPPLHNKREVLNAIFYQLRAGSAWHLLPHDLPPWRTVYKQGEARREDGTCDRLLAGLRQQLRQFSPASQNRQLGLSTCSPCAQAVKGGYHSYDASKQVVGHKRSIVVDTQGFP
jgi:putative transposase